MAGNREWIENTTNLAIPEHLERTLLLGPNFNIQKNKSTPYVRLIADVETAINKKTTANDIRAEVATIMSNHLNFKQQPQAKRNDWIHQDVAASQKFLKEHPEVYVTKADKGNKTVVIEGKEYREKMQQLVNDTTTYKRIRVNPTSSVREKLNKLVEDWYSGGHIDNATRKSLVIPLCCPSPRIYGLPKIHKEGRPLRPVVSTIGSVTYAMAKFLTSILNNIVGKTEYHVRNSFEFAEEISKFHVPEGYVMYSLDVVSLYTNVPVDKIVECVQERWNEVRRYTTIPWGSFKNAMEIVLRSSFFKYDQQLYVQCFGVPMGSPLSPVGSNIVLEKLEREGISKLKEKNIMLALYKRYVDDCLVVGREEEIAEVMQEFNSFHSSLNFTLENENQTKLRFLDMTLERNGEKISKSWYPKQKNGRYLDFKSESPIAHKKNTVVALLDRALKLSDIEHREEGLATVHEILRANNYPLRFIQSLQKQRVDLLYNSLKHVKRGLEPGEKFASLPYIPCLSEKIGKTLKKHGIVAAFKPVDKVRDAVFTKLKDKIPRMQQQNVVYSVPCGTCGMEYVGQTSQFLEKRLDQHERSVRLKTGGSGLAQHAIEMGHVFDYAGTKVLERVEKEKNRKAAEMVHIKLREGRTVNLQRESIAMSNVYTGVVNRLRSRQCVNLTNTSVASSSMRSDGLDQT